MYIGARKKRRKRALFLTTGIITAITFLALAFFLFAQTSSPGEKATFKGITTGPRQGVYAYVTENARVFELIVPIDEQDFWTHSGDSIELHLFAAGDIFERQQYIEQNVFVESRQDRVVLKMEPESPLYALRVLKGLNGYRVEMFRPGLEGKRIAIDPGHGGHDPGAIYPRGTRNPEIMEKDIVLAVSLALRDLLEEAGAIVFMTRETDTLVDKSIQPGQRINPDYGKRRDIVNEWGPDFFVSVHLNSFKSSTAQGLETYYNPDSFNSPASLQAARLLHQSLLEELQRRDRGIKHKPYDSVLQPQDFATVLLEILFITNAGDRAVLSHPDFPRRAAEAIFHGIESYFGGSDGE